MGLVLGIETSCDETAASVVRSNKTILSNVLISQAKQHEEYGGVVPEVASRAHIQVIDIIVKWAIKEAEINIEQLDAIAATSGPGLIGGLIVGMMLGKGMASALKKPFIAVNHLEAHALTARLTSDIPFPYLLLLVSGGHTEILIVEGVGKYKPLGKTLDDALGEAFDKTAKILGLGYPGGPKIEAYANNGDPKRFKFPYAMVGREGSDFSFSGLKTAVKRKIDEIGNFKEQDIADISASFQYTIACIIEDRVKNALEVFKLQYPKGKTLVIAGGVAANQYLGTVLKNTTAKYDMECYAPPIKLCTDNAAMVAWAGIERLALNLINPLDTEPRARWPLESLIIG